jgi:hypothetical protein
MVLPIIFFRVAHIHLQLAKPLILLDITAFGFFLEFVRRGFKTFCPASRYRASR